MRAARTRPAKKPREEPAGGRPAAGGKREDPRALGPHVSALRTCPGQAGHREEQGFGSDVPTHHSGEDGLTAKAQEAGWPCVVQVECGPAGEAREFGRRGTDWWWVS